MQAIREMKYDFSKMEEEDEGLFGGQVLLIYMCSHTTKVSIRRLRRLLDLRLMLRRKRVCVCVSVCLSVCVWRSASQHLQY